MNARVKTVYVKSVKLHTYASFGLIIRVSYLKHLQQLYEMKYWVISCVMWAWYPVIQRLSPSTQRWKLEKVSKTLEINSTFMWLITWEDFKCSNIISGQILEQHILSVLKESHITTVCCKNCWIAVFTKQNTLLYCDEVHLFLILTCYTIK